MYQRKKSNGRPGVVQQLGRHAFMVARWSERETEIVMVEMIGCLLPWTILHFPYRQRASRRSTRQRIERLFRHDVRSWHLLGLVPQIRSQGLPLPNQQ